MKIALIQLDFQPNMYEHNINKAIIYINEAIQKEAKLICLPEAFATTVNIANIERIAEVNNGNIANILSNIAKKNCVNIIAGFIENYNMQYFSSAIFITEDGIIKKIFRKKSLNFIEQRFLNIGDTDRIISFNDFNVGILIGDEIFSSELCLQFKDKDIKLIVCISSLPNSYSNQIKPICQARAFEYDSYIVFTSQVGYNSFSNMFYLGRSMIVAGSKAIKTSIDAYEEGDEILCYADSQHEILLLQDIIIE